MTPTPPTIIIGGGIAGLTAALHLAERGIPVRLYEAGPLLGGRVCGGAPLVLEHAGRAWEFGDEHGVHYLWRHYCNLRGLLTRLQIDAAPQPAGRETWLHRAGGRVLRAEAGSMIRRSPIPAPLHYLACFARPRFLRMLSLWDWLGMPRVLGTLISALAYDPPQEHTALERATLASFFRGWPPAARAFVGALARSGFAADSAEVPLSGFLTFLRFYSLLRRDAWDFHAMRMDAGRALVDPLARAARQAGAQLLTGCRATLLERSAAGWRVHLDGARAEGRHVVLALDAPAAEALLCGSPATALAAAGLRWPRATATAVVRLWFERAPQAYDEAGVCSGSFTIHNFFWLHRMRADAAAWHTATSGALVECHIYGPPATLDLPDATLLALATDDLVAAWPELRGRLIQARLRRNPPSHTLFAIGAASDHLGVETPWPGLVACGDWVRHPSPALFLERACTTAIAAANQVLADHGQPAWPMEAYPPPEPLAAWLQRGARRIRRAVRPNTAGAG